MSYEYLIEPRPYQKDACKLIYKRKRFGLFFEMGTGKTKIALDFIGAMTQIKKIGRTLIVAPLSVLGVWEAEIEKNCHKDLTYTVLRPNKSNLWKQSKVIITNYDYLRTRTTELMEWAPDLIVLDESHKIKNPYAKQSKAAHKIGNTCEYAVLLTGTPIGNRPLDLWSQFKFLVPGLLEPSFKEFKAEYSLWRGPGGYELHKYKNLDKLARIISPHVKTLKKEEVLSLPKKNFIEMPVDIGEKAKKIYREMEDDFVTYVEKNTSSEKVISAPIILAKLTKLSQISGGFIRHTEDGQDFPLHTAKLEVLEGITDDLLEQDTKRVVIFARFSWEIREIRKILAPKWCVYEISGQVSRSERQMAQSLFNEGGGAMICQISTGSLGLNLQSSNYCIFYSMGYSFIDFIQAQDRIHRMGQTLPCFYYILLAKGTIDRRIYSILRQKHDVANKIIDMVKEMKRGRS